MAHVFKISSFGVKLIKAYEGFRPIETTLVSGQRVIGYGHRFQDTEEPVISRKRAEDLLKSDLEAYEDLINENVYAPLSQSQFDALVSLSFNIGPQAFLSSSVLHALNNGRPLAAAAGFDEWRKSVINGKTYVVDALVRRRTAEKSLFLRATEGVVTAPRHEVPPRQDHGLQAFDAGVDVFEKSDVPAVDIQDAANRGNGHVPQTPYAAHSAPTRRREDGPAGIMTLSETEALQAKIDASEIAPAVIHEVPVSTPRDNTFDPHIDGVEIEEHKVVELATDINPKTDKALSPIALAAEEVSERLDRLIADTPETAVKPPHPDTAKQQMVDTVSKPASNDRKQTVDENVGNKGHAGYVKEEQSAGIAEVIANIKAANEGTHEDYRRPANSNTAHTRSPDAYIQQSEKRVSEDPGRSSYFAYWLTFTLGLCLLLYAASRWLLAPKNLSANVSEYSAFITPTLAIIGAMIVLGTFYYLVKSFVRRV